MPMIYGSSIQLLACIPENPQYMHRATYSRMFRAAQWPKLKKKSPSIGKWMNKLWYIYKREFHRYWKEWIWAICKNMGVSYKYPTEEKEEGIKQCIHILWFQTRCALSNLRVATAMPRMAHYIS
jgi:hypothetical protein